MSWPLRSPGHREEPWSQRQCWHHQRLDSENPKGPPGASGTPSSFIEMGKWGAEREVSSPLPCSVWGRTRRTVCPLLIQCSSHAIALFCKKLHRTLKQTSFVLLSFPLEGDVTFTHLGTKPKTIKSQSLFVCVGSVGAMLASFSSLSLNFSICKTTSKASSSSFTLMIGVSFKAGAGYSSVVITSDVKAANLSSFLMLRTQREMQLGL